MDLFCEQNLVPIKTDYENEKIKIKSIHCNIIGDNLPTQYNEVCNSLFDELGDEELIDNTNNVILQEKKYILVNMLILSRMDVTNY